MRQLFKSLSRWNRSHTVCHSRDPRDAGGMGIGEWFSRWRRRHRGSRNSTQHRPPNQSTERLEQRCLLTQAANPISAAAWFQTVQSADPLELTGSVQGVTGATVFLNGDAIVGRWIVQLSNEALTSVGSPAEAESVIDGYGADFAVLHGLGLPGQILVQASRDTLDLAASALHTNPLVSAFEPDAFILGPQEDPQLIPLDSSYDELAGLNNRGQTGGTSDADIDAPEAWHVVDARLEPGDETQVGSFDVVVGVIDSGIDYTHPDLARNIWINPGEIPENIRVALFDTDDDGLITFVDLNARDSNGELIHSVDVVLDRNANGFIDAGDLLDEDSPWIDDVDGDGNGFIDDLTGWDFSEATVNASGTIISPGDNTPLDENRHGTHVSGILGAVGNNNFGISGVSWTVSILPLRFLDRFNRGATSNAILAVNYATMMKNEYVDTFSDPTVEDGSRGANIRITNNSWGGTTSTSGGPVLREAVNQQGVADILFVAAAGNGNALGQGDDIDQEPFFPASYEFDHVITVAAVDYRDELVRFSNFGVQSVDLAAPGLGILSTVPGGQFRRLNGTSMAAPHVAGTAALIAALSPDATATEIRTAILDSVDTVPTLLNRVATGGRLNAFGAVTIDRIRPRAELAVDDITDADQDKQTQVFTVTYTDNVAVDVSSFGGANVQVVRAETGESFPATLQPDENDEDGPLRSATYSITPPGGFWDATDNGTYVISLLDGQVLDTSGIFAAAQVLGSFRAELTREGQFNVNSTVDSIDQTPGDGQFVDALGRRTLRAAVMESNADPADNTIVLTAGDYTLTIPGTDEDQAAAGDLDVEGTLTIIGAADGRTVIDAGELDRVFDVRPGAELILQNVTITGGVAPSGESGGGIRNVGTLTIDRTTLNDNESTADGGAIANLGDATASLTNVTLSGNRAARGAGVFNEGTLTLLNTTITQNTATVTAGGVFNESGAINVQNTLIAANTLSPANPSATSRDLAGAFTSAGNNVIGDPSGSTGITRDVAGNLVGTGAQPLNPQLGPLSENDGTNFSHDLLPGSPALNSGNNNAAPPTDQRGLLRRPDGIGTVDIGAVEQVFASISGIKFHDLDADGIQDLEDTNGNGQLDDGEDLNENGVLDQEPGLDGFRIYLDLNENGVRDGNEPVAVTGEDGRYEFTRLLPDDYTILESPAAGFDQTTPLELEFTDFSLTAGGRPSAVTSGDFNGDGRTDLAVANRLSNDVLVYFNNGRASFETPLQIVLPNNAAPVALVAGDYTGDGLIDLAVASQVTNDLRLLRNIDGTGFALDTPLSLSAAPTSLASGRVEGINDPDTDLVVTFTSANTATVLLNDGNGVFTASSTLAVGDEPQSAALADFDGDGKQDLVTASRDGLTFFAQTDSATFVASNPINSGGLGPQSVIAADFDLDGDVDVVVTNTDSSAGSSLAVHLNRGTGTLANRDRFIAPVTFAGGVSPTAIQAADLDGDGALDLAILNESSNTLTLLLNSTETSAGTIEGASHGGALTLVVNSTADKVDLNPGDGVVDTGTPGEVTLRAAIMEANAHTSDDTIQLPAGTYTLTLGGANEDFAATGDLDVTDNLTIVGAGAGQTIIDANQLDRVFHILASVVSLEDLTITGGSVTGSDPEGHAGGVWNDAGTLTITRSVVTGNTAQQGAGGISNGQADSPFTGTLNIVDSTISNNTGLDGGGISNVGQLIITNSTISGNTALNDGGGISQPSAGPAVITVVNSTITDNSAANNGAGIMLSGGDVVRLKNTIVAGNSNNHDIQGSIQTLGNNLIGGIRDGLGTNFVNGVNGDQVGTESSPIDAMLGRLRDNGGPTPTHTLLSDSPAIDAGSEISAPVTDQRGQSRPLDGDNNALATTDIGAVEVEFNIAPVLADVDLFRCSANLCHSSGERRRPRIRVDARRIGWQHVRTSRDRHHGHGRSVGDRAIQHRRRRELDKRRHSFGIVSVIA